MPEDEFELYLTLLAKTLRLKDDQRDAIAAELRDHMENRLRELMLQGIEREQAIETALAEFGDASALGHDLTHSNPQRIHSRRRLMQTTFGTLAACAAVTFGVMLLTPNNYKGDPTQPGAVAQLGGAAPSPEREKQIQAELTALNEKLTEIRGREERADKETTDLHKKLKSKTTSISFDDKPLGECLDVIRNEVGINIVVNWAEFALHGGPKQDTPISLQLQEVTADIALDMLLRVVPQDAFADDRLAYSLCDGVVIVSTKGNLLLGSPYIPTQVLGTRYIQSNNIVVGQPIQPHAGGTLRHNIVLGSGATVVGGKDRKETLINELLVVQTMIEEQEALKSRIKVEIDAYNKELDAIATKVDEGLIKIDSAETQSLELSKAELMLRHQQFVQRILKLEEEAMLLRKELELISD